METRNPNTPAVREDEQPKPESPQAEPCGGRYWIRTSGFHRVRMALYR